VEWVIVRDELEMWNKTIVAYFKELLLHDLPKDSEINFENP
jgi:hypothetical protein